MSLSISPKNANYELSQGYLELRVKRVHFTLLKLNTTSFDEELQLKTKLQQCRHKFKTKTTTLPSQLPSTIYTSKLGLLGVPLSFPSIKNDHRISIIQS